MRQYKFDKPLVESTYPPKSKDVYWIDIDEQTGKINSIKEYKSESAVYFDGDDNLVETTVSGWGGNLSAGIPTITVAGRGGFMEFYNNYPPELYKNQAIWLKNTNPNNGLTLPGMSQGDSETIELLVSEPSLEDAGYADNKDQIGVARIGKSASDGEDLNSFFYTGKAVNVVKTGDDQVYKMYLWAHRTNSSKYVLSLLAPNNYENIEELMFGDVWYEKMVTVDAPSTSHEYPDGLEVESGSFVDCGSIANLPYTAMLPVQGQSVSYKVYTYFAPKMVERWTWATYSNGNNGGGNVSPVLPRDPIDIKG